MKILNFYQQKSMIFAPHKCILFLYFYRLWYRLQKVDIYMQKKKPLLKTSQNSKMPLRSLQFLHIIYEVSSASSLNPYKLITYTFYNYFLLPKSKYNNPNTSKNPTGPLNASSPTPYARFPINLSKPYTIINITRPAITHPMTPLLFTYPP